MIMANNNENKVLNVPNLRFPEFSGEWEKCTIGELTIKVGSGVTPRGGEAVYKTEGHPFVRSQNVGLGQLLLDDIAYIDEDTHQRQKNTELQLDDVLLNITGASIGRSAIATKEIAGGNVNQHVCIIRTQDNLISSFLCNFLLSSYGQKQIDSFQAGGNRQGLNFEQIKSIKIAIPTVNEQYKIAQLLQLVEGRIATQNKIIEDLKKLKSVISQIIFRNSTLVKIQNLCEVIMGQSPSSSSYNSNNDGLPLIQGNLDILDGITISRIYTNEPTKISLPKDLILTVRAPVGIVAENKMKVCIGRGVCALRNKSAMPTMYIYYALDYFSYKWKQIEQGSTFTSINGDDVKNFTIPLVDDVEYSCALLSKVDVLIKCSIDLHSNYIKQKQYLLSQLFI